MDRRKIIDCIVCISCGNIKIKRADGLASINFSSETKIDANRFLVECQVGNIEELPRMGYDRKYSVMLGAEWVMKSWWKDRKIQLLFYPRSSVEDFKIKRNVHRTKKERLKYSIANSNPDRIPSAGTFFSTQPAPKKKENFGPPRKRGQMVWVHKTAPEIEIEGSKGLAPDDIAKMRRR